MPGGRNRIDFEIGFSTDESGLKKLQANLTQIMNIGNGKDPLKGLTEGEQQAIQNAGLLKDALQKAYNADLGTTNISKVNSELNKSGVTINQCRESFRNLGAQGANAYNLLGTQILSTNVKIKQTNKLLDKMAVTMANTVRFGISSSIFNNVTGALSKAVGYAEDLNESLTSIRIVSGQSAEQMQKFAVQANTAAKGLGATTLDYTDASLIYYQQGLGQEEVEKRTNVTLEMANVLGTSAKEVSNYMTAIWNNFDDGSKSLEYYGDVIAKLGATTASSAEEIADGLEKFAAIGDTVGLSYEYATASLATVVAETRQSADTVGTAFKTIFARLQGLELGDTLEDGTDLNKYSLALSKVGISIKDQNGELKKMDDILNEMGAKWQTLGKDQQVALAETVAGTRQYAQLVALMDNWDKVTENIEVAKDATGTLAEQQEIYMESTEAKLKTLKATWQDLYGSILQSDTLNVAIEGATNLVQVFDNFFDSFGGGIKSVVALGAVLANIFNKQLANAVISFKDRLKESVDNAELLRIKAETIRAEAAKADGPTRKSEGYAANYDAQASIAKQIQEIQSGISQEQYNQLTNEQEKIGMLAQEQKELEFQLNVQKEKNNQSENTKKIQEEINQKLTEEKDNLILQAEIFKDNAEALKLESEEYDKQITKSQEIVAAIENEVAWIKEYQVYQEDINASEQEQKDASEGIEKSKRQIEKLLESINSQYDDINITVEDILNDEKTVKEVLEQQGQILRENAQAYASGAVQAEEQNIINDLKEEEKLRRANVEETVKLAKENAKISTVIADVTGAIGGLAMALSTVKSLWQTLTDENASWGDKLLQVFLTIGMTVPTILINIEKLRSGWGSLMTLFGKKTASTVADTIVTEANTKAAAENAVAQGVVKKTAESAAGGLIKEAGAADSAAGSLMAAGGAGEVAGAGAEIAATGFAALIPGLLIVAAVIGAVIAAIAYMVKLENRYRDEAKKTAEASKELASSYKEVKTEAEALNETISDWKSSRKAIDDLTVGTEEWKKQIEQTNEKAKELIETYELYGRYSTDDDGIITINSDALQEVQQAENSKVENVHQASIAANMRNDKAKIMADAEKINSESRTGTENIESAASYIAKLLNDYRESNPSDAPATTQEFISNEYLTKAMKAQGMSAEDIANKLNELGIVIENDTIPAFADLVEKEQDYINKQNSLSDELSRSIVDERYGAEISQRVNDKGGNEQLAYTIGEVVANAISDQKLDNKDSEWNGKTIGEAIAAANEKADKRHDDSLIKELYKDKKDYKWGKVLSDNDLGEMYAKYILGEGNAKAKGGKFGETKITYGEGDNQKTITKNDEEMRKALVAKAYMDEIEEEFGQLSDATEKTALKMMESSENMEQVSSLMENLANSDKGTLSGLDLSNVDISLGSKKNTGASAQEVFDSFGINPDNMEEADWQALGFQDAQAFVDAFNEQLKQWDLGDWADAESEKIKASLQTATDAFSALSEGKELTEDQAKALASLEEQYIDLGTIQDRTSQAYLDKLLQIREELEQQKIELLQLKEADSIDDAIGMMSEITPEVSDEKLEEFQDKLEEICEEDYQVLVEVKADMQDDFDTVTNQMDKMEDMASKIGDDFKVAADDIEELNDAFPGILEGMQILGDGVVQLNKEAVETAMEGAKAEVQADTQATIEKLENRKAELEAKRDAAQKMADITAQLAAGEVEADEIMEEASEALRILQTDMSDDASQNQQADDKDIADTAAEASADLANNFTDAFNEVIKNSAAMANAVSDNLKSAAEGTGASNTSELTANYVAKHHTVSTKDSSNTEISSKNDLKDKTKDFQKISDMYANLAKSYDEAANNTAGKIAELMAKDVNFTKKAENIASGKGADGKSGSGGKSGGGSKEKEITPKDTKSYDEEFDRYRDINRQLGFIADALEKVDKIQEHVFGKQLIQSLKNENKLLKEQKKVHEQLLAAQKAERAEKQAALAAAGGQFDANGELTNYAALSQSALAQYNQKVAEYNSGAIDDDAFSAFEKQYNDLKSMIDGYDQLNDKIKETKKAIEEYEQKVRDNNLKAWEIDLELKLNEKVLERQWNDFLHKINTDFKKIYSDLGKELSNIQKNSKTYVGKKGTINTDINAIKDVKKEINKIMKGGKSNKFASLSEAQEKLKELNQQLMDDGDALYEMYQKAYETYLEDIDQYADKLDEINKKYDRITADLEHQGRLMELVYGDKAYAMMDKLYTAQINTSKGQVDSYKQQYEAYKKQYEAAAKGSKEQKKFYDLMCQAQDNYNASLEKTVELLQTKLKNAINAAFDELEKALTNGIGFDKINDEWDKLIEHQNKYYDKTETLYQAQTLANKVTKQMEDLSGNLKAQQKLQDFYDTHINQMREKSEISKKQVEYENQALAVLQAEIALEEAQNAKNSMKMVRGADGNWSYQYTADDDATEEKKQSLLDEMNGLYLLAREGYQECVESMTKVEQERVQKLKEIAEDTVLTEEEKIAKMKEVNDYYDAEQKRLKEEMAQWELNLHVAEAEEMLGLYENDIENYSYMTEGQKTLLDGVRDQGIQDFITMEDAMKGNIKNIYDAADNAIKETVPAWTSGAASIARSWSGNPDSVEKMVNKCITECIKATQDYEREIDKLGISMNKLTAAIEADEEATAALQDATEEMTDAMEEGLERDREALAKVEAAWESVKGSIESAIASLREYLQLMQDIKNVEAQQITPGGGGANLGGGGSGSGGSSDGGSGAGSIEGVAAAIWMDGGATSGWYNGNDRTSRLKEKGVTGAQAYINAHGPNGDIYAAWHNKRDQLKSFYYGSFDTGGYTGEWGDGSGKLAFLHQKEIVLNKTDTQNMLDAVNAVRDIQSTSGAIDQAIMKSIAGMVAKMAGLSPLSTNGITNSTTSTDNSQVVYNVEANFPNAGDIMEIQQAILNLPNLARQQGSLNKK